MALDIDAILDRRRLKRHLALWRLVALSAALALILVLIPYRPTRHWLGYDVGGAWIARLTIAGDIVEDPQVETILADVADDSEIKALIVHVDSPGGTTTGSEALYQAIRRVASVKPVVTTMGTMAASGGYIVALGGDYIIARETTITGSIGVIYSVTDLHKLMETIGVKVDSIKSAPLKGEPSGYAAMDEPTRKAVQAVVDDTYHWFLDLVAERRGLPPDRVRALGDGRIYTGRQALQNKLVDALGGEELALDWLDKTRDVDPDLPIEDLSIEPPRPWYEVLTGRAAAAAVREVLESKRGFLDGLRSVWHP